MSSVSVLIASIAGLLAINKWKVERFEKVKIETLERYEESVRSIRLKIYKICGKNLEFEIHESNISFKNENNETISSVLNKVKREGLVELREIVYVAEDNIDKYISYSGERMLFSYNYYKSSCDLMFETLSQLGILAFIKDFESDNKCFTELVVEHLKTSDFSLCDFSDFTFIQRDNLSHVFGMAAGLKVEDNRYIYDEMIYKLVRLEKRYLYSGFLGKTFIKGKIFVLKYNISGRVLLLGDKFSYIVNAFGSVQRVERRGRGKKELECVFRKNLFFNMIKMAF